MTNNFDNHFVEEIGRNHHESPWPKECPQQPNLTQEVTDSMCQLSIGHGTGFYHQNDQENQKFEKTPALVDINADHGDIPLGDETAWKSNNQDLNDTWVSTEDDYQSQHATPNSRFSMAPLRSALRYVQKGKKWMKVPKVGKRITKAEKKILGPIGTEKREKQLAVETSRRFKQARVDRAKELIVMKEKLIVENQECYKKYNTLYEAYDSDFIIDKNNRNYDVQEAIMKFDNNGLEQFKHQCDSDEKMIGYKNEVKFFFERILSAENERKQINDFKKECQCETKAEYKKKMEIFFERLNSAKEEKEKNNEIRRKSCKKGKKETDQPKTIEKLINARISTLTAAISKDKKSMDLNQLEYDVLRLKYEKASHEKIWKYVQQSPIVLELKQAVQTTTNRLYHLSENQIGIVKEVRGILEMLDFG